MGTHCDGGSSCTHGLMVVNGTIAIAVVLGFVAILGCCDVSWEQRGQVGDTFGVLNAFVNILVMLFLVHQVRLTREELAAGRQRDAREIRKADIAALLELESEITTNVVRIIEFDEGKKLEAATSERGLAPFRAYSGPSRALRDKVENASLQVRDRIRRGQLLDVAPRHEELSMTIATLILISVAGTYEEPDARARFYTTVNSVRKFPDLALPPHVAQALRDAGYPD